MEVEPPNPRTTPTTTMLNIAFAILVVVHVLVLS